MSAKEMGYNTEKPEAHTEVSCPYCDSSNTELFSLFGQQLLTVQYYCNACHTPFECIKDDAILDDYTAQVARKESQP